MRETSGDLGRGGAGLDLWSADGEITRFRRRSGFTSVLQPWGAGRGSGARGSGPPPQPCAWGRVLPTTPPKDARSRPHLRREADAHRTSPDSFVGGSVGAGPTGQWPQRWALKQKSPHRELARGGSLGFPVRAKGLSCHVPASHASLGAASSRSPPGPLSPPRRLARRSPGGYPAGWAAASPPGDLTSLSKTHQAWIHEVPRRETEAGEAGTCLSHRAGQGRAVSKPRPHLNCSAGLGPSHPPPPCRENSESSFPRQSPFPCPAHFCRGAKPL